MVLKRTKKNVRKYLNAIPAEYRHSFDLIREMQQLAGMHPEPVHKRPPSATVASATRADVAKEKNRIKFSNDLQSVYIDGERADIDGFTPTQMKIIRYCMELKEQGNNVFDYNNMPSNLKPSSPRLIDVFRTRKHAYHLLFENHGGQEYLIKF